MNNNNPVSGSLGGPNRDTQAGDIVIVVVPPDSNYGVKFIADQDGCAAIIESFEKLPSGKFGPIQKHGGVHVGDVLFEFNDLQLMNTNFTEVCRMLGDKNVLKRELKFMNKKEYYRRKRGNSMRINPIDGKNSFLSTIKRTRIAENKSKKFIEYEVSCQMRVVGTKLQKEVVYQWSVWKRYSEFRALDEQLRRSLGWQMNGIEFPSSYWLTWNKLAPEFTELRREELKDYWQKVIEIDKVTEFQKHHCSEDLKLFLEVEQSTAAPVNAVADMVDENPEEGEGEKVTPSNRRGSLNRGASRRLSATAANRNTIDSPKHSNINNSNNTNPNTNSNNNSNGSSSPTNRELPPPPPPPVSRSNSVPPPPPPSTAPAAPTINNSNNTTAEKSSGGANLPPKASGARANLLSSINALRKE